MNTNALVLLEYDCSWGVARAVVILVQKPAIA